MTEYFKTNDPNLHVQNSHNSLLLPKRKKNEPMRHKHFKLLTATMLAVSLNGKAAETLKVSLTDSIRPVTHCASGSLYGMTEDLPTDIQGLVAPLKPHMFCQPPEGTNKNQHPFGDGFIIAERLKGTTAQVQITLPDLLPYWPYKWPGQQSWLKAVEGYLNRKQEMGLTNIHSYVIWNEPDGTWNDANGSLYTTVWKPTYELIKKLDPEAKVVGPCIAYYHNDRMKNFLKFCKENNCLPDEICWHQWGSEGLAGAIESARKLEDELGIPHLPICINEYCAGSGDDKKKFEGCPGYSVPFIAKFERYGVESATISWWFTNLPGRLGSLLTDKNQKGGGWWLYKWYGDMEGYMAKVTPPYDKSDRVDGFAAVDRKNNCASVVIGGNTEGDVNVVFETLPAFMGGKVKVRIERVTWQSKDTPVSGTDLLSEEEMALNGTTLTVPVKIENKVYAYRIFMTPVDVPQTPYKGIAAEIPGKVEAENYDVAGQGFSYYDNDTENKGENYREDGVDIVTAEDGFALGYTEKGEWTEYTVDVKKTQKYVLYANISCANELEGFDLYLDGNKLNDSYTLAATCDDWSKYEKVKIGEASLDEGQHTLKLEIVGNFVNVDWLEFENAEMSGVDKIYSISDLRQLTNARVYDMMGNAVKIENLKKNVVYILTTTNKTDNVKFVLK